ncbi:MAG TPA: serine hydrolase [Steroidobacteraceae bacterium]|nr:serine hydrolase [Steroidobacteraceae bacterium]
MFRIMAVLVVAVSALGFGAAYGQETALSAKPWTFPSDAEIRRILAQRIDEQHQGVGMVVGVIDAHGRRVISYGTLDKADPRQPDGRTIFEIGSVTKVFTSLLLADMVQSGEVKLDDPMAKYLPPGTKVPERGGRQITLIDLATHTSGLPRLPTNFTPQDPSDPYADYSAQKLYAFLKGYSLPRDIGAKYEYSNTGAGLLGYALARRAGMDFGALVQRRITGPLGMRSTAITLAPAEMSRLAPGHDARLNRSANWDFTTLAGAGALRSDADDMLTFLGAELGYVKTPLAKAMKAQLEPRRPTDIPNTVIALGWHITAPLVWHDGGTGGYRSMIAFDPKQGVGVVVLSNTFTTAGVDDILVHLFAGTPLAPPPPPPPPPTPSVEHHASAVDATVLQGLVGRYQAAPNLVVEITLQDGQLYARLTGQPRFPVFPEGQHRVFWKVVDAQADFAVDARGRATAMTLHQGGQDLQAPRIEDKAKPGP